ncbi:DNA repair protein Rev1 isoform X2 [Prorops nasuta]|uniref:DNA repair protein Rev1 isoform X2 n=1 Tax=Prorops nasuta TaxID=863751 RepID=UPI0034CD6F9E
MSRKKKPDQNGFEEWGGYMEAKKAKLEEQFRENANNEFKEATSNIFKDIAIFVNGYTSPTADELRRLMMAHGGIYHHYMRPKITTHIIASNLPYSKIVAYKKNLNALPICKPEWIIRSIEAGKVLNYKDYLLYSHFTEAQQQLNFKQIDNKPLINTLSEGINLNTENCLTEKSNSVNGKKQEGDQITAEKPNNSALLKTHAQCSKDSDFLTEFYNNSRLHHIATMGATFKEYINELREKHNGKFLGFDKLMEMKKSHQAELRLEYNSDSDEEIFTPEDEKPVNVNKLHVIMHIDMDCFFVSVGIRNRPELKGLPIAVTHAKGNKQTSGLTNNDEKEYGSLSEIASCSYEARKAGLKNGMFLGQALKLCPNLKIIQYDFEAYKEVSYVLYDTVASYTLDIEAVSCDEMYADCSKILQISQMTPLEFATIIRNEIKEKTGCPVSTGFGSNKLQARLATKKAKPDGQFYLITDAVETYIGAFDVKDLPGVGYTTTKKLNKLGVQTCSDLQNVDMTVLQKEFGKKTGEILYNMCRGIDNSKLNFKHVRKSISAEVNYGIRFENNGDAVDFLKKLSIEVCSRLKKVQAKGRTIVLKLMIRAKDAPVDPAKFMGHGLCDYLTKSKNLITAVDDPNIITREIITLWNQVQQIPQDVRGIGVQINKLETTKIKNHLTNFINLVNKSNNCNKTTELIEINENKNTAATSSANENKRKDLKSLFSKMSNDMDKNNVKKNLSTTEKQKNIVSICNNLPSNTETVKIAMTKVQAPISNGNETERLPMFSLESLDTQILKELPEDIRNEILNEYNLKFNFSNCKQLSKIDRSEENKSLNIAGPSEQDPNSLNNSYFLIPSQEIDNTILNQLPEDMRTEIVTAQSKKRNLSEEKPLSQTQKRQQDYFKQVKPSSTKTTKSYLPSLKEIDMCVLAELPEDIRNEIFNEYNANKCKSEANDDIKTLSRSNLSKPELEADNDMQQNFTENLSFSQIDPDYLAALTDEMKKEVQIKTSNCDRERGKL